MYENYGSGTEFSDNPNDDLISNDDDIKKFVDNMQETDHDEIFYLLDFF